MSPLEDDFDPKRRMVATYGRFAVWLDPLVHLPWGLYRIYVGGRYIGGQISFPSKSDCECILHNNAKHANGSPTGTWRNKQKLRGVASPAYRQQWQSDELPKAA